MTSKQRKSPTKEIKLNSALNHEQWQARIESLSPDEVFKLAQDLHLFLFYWMGEPTEQAISDVQRLFPILDEFVDFKIVLQRLEIIDSFKRSEHFGVHISTFFPELTKIRNALLARIALLPPGVDKAEGWLRSIVQEAKANSDLEAVIYFVSRGHKDVIDVTSLRNAWHSAICLDIERGMPVGKVADDVLERARSQTISLAEAAEVLRFSQLLPRFFSFRDEEEDFIDATLFRAVEWLGITGFDAWLKSFASELSSPPEPGYNRISIGWWLFHWFRSDLALNMAEKPGLEAQLWALTNGEIEREKPWRIFWSTDNKPRTRDYIPLAGIVLFVCRRIESGNIRESTMKYATDLLAQTQMRSGAWPLYTDSSEPEILATCMAIYGLALNKPEGWRQMAARGANWLRTQQNPQGFWHIEGGPPVMLTVLVLDALALADGDEDITFKIANDRRKAYARKETESDSINQIALIGPVYNYENEEWLEPTLPSMISKSLVESHKAIKPDLAIVVATVTELRQALHVMEPLPKLRRIWKVSHNYDTYYIGRVGVHSSVLMLSSAGSEGPTGSTLSVDAVIREWEPRAILYVGIAFGTSRKKHLPADVIVSEQLIPYELQRIGKTPIFRNPIPPSSASLVNRFRNALGWTFYRPDNSRCKMHVGPVLSGQKLLDQSDFKEALLDQYPNAIGGEMEGSGLWSAAQRARKEWILVKGVCDWADGGKNDDYQAMAAASAFSLCKYVFSDAHALDGL